MHLRSPSVGRAGARARPGPLHRECNSCLVAKWPATGKPCSARLAAVVSALLLIVPNDPFERRLPYPRGRRSAYGRPPFMRPRKSIVRRPEFNHASKSQVS